METAFNPFSLANKRVLGYLNWIKNRHAIHRREVLDGLVADLKAHAPDQIAVTPDSLGVRIAKVLLLASLNQFRHGRVEC